MSRFELPVIDIGPYLRREPGSMASIAREVDAACRSIGFLVLDNHGIPRALIDRVFQAGRVFFDQSMEEKLPYLPADRFAPRGYQAFASRNLGKTYGLDTPPDLREQFFVGPLHPAPERYSRMEGAAPFYSGNIWPTQPPEYRAVLSEFYTVMGQLAGSLMRLFAVALALDETFFDDKIDHHFSTCPLNHYPVVASALPGQLRTGPHTDFGSLTILALDDAPGGLQVALPGSSWADVRPRPDQLIVNLGDMMARWTNDRWRSTVHRVVNPPAERRAESRRMSVGYFLHPNYDTEVSCLPTCQDADTLPRYPPIMAGEHMREKLERRIDE